jgi:hypothetical protein
MKKFLFLISILLLINIVSGAQLRINPPKIEFNGNIGDKICKEISVYTDYNGNILEHSRWSIKDSKDINDYGFSQDDFGLNLNFPEHITAKNYEREEVCIIANKEGEYHGVLLFNAEESPVGVGIWISANINGNSNINNSSNNPSKITGDAINTNASSKNELIFLCSLFTFLLLCLLVSLIFYQNKVVR